MTQVGGVAYVANNIYFSSWATLFACVYTLDQWSASKDILCIAELTGISATLKSWYLLFLASVVTMGTCCDLMVHLSEKFEGAASYGIVLGLISTLISLFFILVHYRFVDFEFLQVGGWIELSASFFMILVWIIGVSVLTSEGGLAATIGGSGCGREKARLQTDYGINEYDNDCYIIWVPEEEESSESEDVDDATMQPSAVPLPTSQPSSMTTAPTTSASPTMVNQTASPTTISETGTPTEGLTSTSVPESGAPTEALDTSSSTEAPTMSPSIDNSTETTTMSPTYGNVSNVQDDDIAITDGLAGDDDEVLTNEIMVVTMVVNNGTSTNGTLPRWLQETDMEGEEKSFFLNETNQTFSFILNETNQTFAPSPYPSVSPTTRLPSGMPSTMPSSSTSQIPYTQKAECSEIVDNQIPGSNLYLAAWICFFASFNITLRWKAAQALQFAQAQNRKATEGMEQEMNDDSEGGGDGEGGEKDEDDIVEDSAADDDL